MDDKAEGMSTKSSILMILRRNIQKDSRTKFACFSFHVILIFINFSSFTENNANFDGVSSKCANFDDVQFF